MEMDNDPIQPIRDVSPSISQVNAPGGERPRDENRRRKREEKTQGKPLPPDLLESVLNELRRNLKPFGIEPRVEVNEASGEVALSLVRLDTKQVVRRVPSAEILLLRQHMEELVGLIFDRSV